MSSSAITGPVFSDNKRAPAGTAAAPSFAFNDSTGTGVYLVSAGVLGLSTNGAQRVVVDTSGNVGIGTASPGSKLHITNAGTVISRIENTATNAAALVQVKNTVGSTYLGQDNTGGYVLTDYSAPILFYTNNAERMRIDASGNLLVARTSTMGNPGGVVNATMFVQNGVQVTDSTNSTNYQYDRISFNRSVFYVLNQNSAGVSLTNGQTAWAAQSDERIKDIIEPITDAVEKVTSLRAVIGKYKSDEEGTRRSFLIAQDVQTVLPEAVSAVDDELGTLNLRYTETIPLLVAAIKEQQEIINALEARLAALESK